MTRQAGPHRMMAEKRWHMSSLFIAGRNETLLWGMGADERIARIGRAAGLGLVAIPIGGDVVANSAFAFDPAWLHHIAALPGALLTLGGVPVIGHARTTGEAHALAQWMDGGPAVGTFTIICGEEAGALENEALRKREAPFVLPLTPASVAAAERASYYGAYKSVTDLLTKHLWPEWAFALTRLAARIGLTPNMVTTIGLVFCVVAGLAFADGHYWLGMASGLIFMVLDTVDGKLARSTITSSWWGNIYDHGIDLIHPPIWWWAWSLGLVRFGTPLPVPTVHIALTVILAAYVVQRLIEGAFIAAFRMHIHVWRPIDSCVRLITARRNPNMLLLFALLCFGRPDLGFLALAWWSGLCCLFHIIRLGQAWISRARRQPVVSWLTA